MDIVQDIGNARSVMQVLQCAFAVIAPVYINHMHRRAGGAVMHPIAANL